MLKRAHILAWFGPVLVLAAFCFVPSNQRFEGALVSSVAFAAVLSCWLQCRPLVKTPLCPWNWALAVFGIQLVGLPLLITILGPSEGELPRLPSSFATNMAMVINSIAFLSFAWAYKHGRVSGGIATKTFDLDLGRPDNRTTRSSGRFVAICIALGLLGVLLVFGNLAMLKSYFSDPLSYLLDSEDLNSSMRGLAGLLLTPFLGFGLIAAWCSWMDRPERKQKAWRRAAITLLSICGITLSYSIFRYNRGAFAVPLVAIFAVPLAKKDRGSVRAMMIGGILALAMIIAYGMWRVILPTGDNVVPDTDYWDALSEKVDVPGLVEAYGVAPQYLAYFLESTHWGMPPRWGAITASSILSPLPILGKAFRTTSGPIVYNRLIYGGDLAHDEIAPFQGEAYSDLGILGVIGGYCALGWLASFLQRAFESSRSCLEVYVWQFLAVWMLFAIFGTISVPSQILIYSCWPIYSFWFTSRHAIRLQRSERPEPSLA